MNHSNENEDLSLIREALEGNRDSFGALVDKYKDALFNFVYKLMYNRDDAMDVCQDTYLKAYTHLKEFKVEYKFSTWLYTIAINTSRNKLKRRKFAFFSIDKPVQNDDEEITDEPADTAETTEQALLKKEKNELLSEIIRSLSPDYRIPFLLKHEENRSLEEIAGITGLSTGVVKIRIHRARNILFKKFKERV